jgi:formate hydrogenlyase transcriptional activator
MRSDHALVEAADPAHLEVLRRVSEHVAVGRDPGEVLRTITDGLVRLADVASCVVSLMLPDNECEVCRLSPPREPSDQPRLHRHTLSASGGFGFDPALHIIPLGGLYTGRAAAERRVQLVNDLPEEYEALIRARQAPGPETIAHVTALRAHGILSGVFFPLMVRGDLVGVLSLLARRRIGPVEARHLEIFALYAAAEIRSAQLLSQVDRLKERLQEENAYLQSAVEEEGGFGGIIGGSQAMRQVLALIRQVGPGDTTVLLTGETGTGKELVARALHAASGRATHPLIKVNCGAIAPGLVESELFGHERGAFTGALQRRLGRFELAHRGTLFLDEVGELPPEIQVKLLRVLQEREFERLGGERTVQVDVRLIAATHRDLARDVADGRFRSDLYYRLNVFPIAIPPLRERREDIPILTTHFLSHLAAELQKPITSLNPGGMERLTRYSWPGNVRELQNVLERAAVLATGPRIEIPELVSASAAGTTSQPGERPRRFDEMARLHIVQVLQSVQGRIEGRNGAAAILGLRPSTLRSRMRRLGIPRGES